MIQVNSYTDLTNSLDSEYAVLGSVLVANNVMDEIAEMLEPRDFTIVAHELIWKGMKYRYRKNETIDLVTISAMLQQYGRLEEIGGIGYLSKLSSYAISPHAAKLYAETVRSRAYRRRAIEAGTRIMEIAQDGDIEDDETLFRKVEHEAMSVRPQNSGDIKSLADSRQEYFDYLNSNEDFIYTGFKLFDEWMGGIGRNWLYILAARPSVGKTAKMLQMIRNVAEQNVGDILVWSQEMNRNQLLNRMMASGLGINGSKIRRKELTFNDKMRMNDEYDRLEKLPLFIEDAKNVTIDEIRAYARQHKRKYGKLGLIAVDYLTILNIVQQKGETRSQAVGYVTRTAKQMARELDVPFLMLAQLSRQGADEPKLEHLRDSGEIEQDADVVEFLWHNPEVTDPNGKVIQSIIAKGRDVGTNQFQYLFKGWIQRYEEYSTHG